MSDYPFQPIVNIAEICARKQVTQVVLSPGSRCAPLTIAFARHPKVNALTISDERSAGFIALGISQQTNRAVALVCTSGSAGLNYAPAVAEAFYQQVPLVIFTADRPPEWIDQLDGQTVRQRDMFGRHCKASYELPVDYNHPDAVWHIERVVNEAINTSLAFPAGPVQINAPFREPFYPTAEQEIRFDREVRIIEFVESRTVLPDNILDDLRAQWRASGKILIVSGQDRFKPRFKMFLDETQVPLIGDVIANLHGSLQVIRHHDIWLSSADMQEKMGAPDLLITFGKSVISKNIKTFLRRHPPKQHWHIQPSGNSWATAADTYQSLTKIIPVDLEYFIERIWQSDPSERPVAAQCEDYLARWREADAKVNALNQQFLQEQTTFSEFEAVEKVMRQLPKDSTLHLANSMTVRYANFLNLSGRPHVEVFANRGTSGIDGSTSTAVGHSLADAGIHTLITGDLAFFYDRNALWNNYLGSNLRIIVLNNHGGGIFKMIDGPGKQPEADEYFVTRQPLLARRTAEDANMEYHYCSTRDELTEILKTFFHQGSYSKLLEIETQLLHNQEVWQNYKKFILGEMAAWKGNELQE